MEQKEINVRFDLVVSYWVFVWFIIYFIQINVVSSNLYVIPNPFWILVFFGVLVTIELFRKIIVFLIKYNNNSITKEEKRDKILNLTFFFLVNVIIKLIPILLLISYQKYKFRSVDIWWSLCLCIIYFIYSFIIHKKKIDWTSDTPGPVTSMLIYAVSR